MTDTYKLTCPNSEDGAHDFEFSCDWASCTKCRYEVKTHKAVDELNTAAREIRRLEEDVKTLQTAARLHARRATVAQDKVDQRDATIAELREQIKEYLPRIDALVNENSELREQLSRVRVSAVPSSEAREPLDPWDASANELNEERDNAARSRLESPREPNP